MLKMDIEKNFNLARRHKDFNDKIMQELKSQSCTEILSVSTSEARKIYNWNRQVAGCYQRSRAFARLKISPSGILYGRIEPEHYVEDLVARWFSSRFPGCVIMIESKRGTFVITKERKLELHKLPLSDLLTKFEKILPKHEIFQELQDFNDDLFWKKYYSSQLIKERKNRKYFQKNIPRKFHDWEGLKFEKERFEGNKTIEEFR